MRIAKTSLGLFIIIRNENGMNEQGFAMFVDHDKLSWTSKLYFAQKYRTEMEAADTLKEIRRRMRERRGGAGKERTRGT